MNINRHNDEAESREGEKRKREQSILDTRNSKMWWEEKGIAITVTAAAAAPPTRAPTGPLGKNRKHLVNCNDCRFIFNIINIYALSHCFVGVFFSFCIVENPTSVSCQSRMEKALVCLLFLLLAKHTYAKKKHLINSKRKKGTLLPVSVSFLLLFLSLLVVATNNFRIQIDTKTNRLQW